jgi:hypothetical protein
MANESDWISASTSTHFADYGSPVTLPANTGVVAVARFVIFSFIVALLLIGNALTLWAIATTDRLRDKAYSLTTSLSATDFVLGIVVSNYIVHESMTSTPCDMATYKSIARPLERMAIYASFLHVSPITIDRFVAVVYPFQYESRMTPNVTRLVVVGIWIIAAVFSLPPYVGFLPAVKPSSCIVTYWPVYESFVEFSGFCWNTVIVAVAYLKIWKVALRLEIAERRQVVTVSATYSLSSSSAAATAAVVLEAGSSVGGRKSSVGPSISPPVTQNAPVTSNPVVSTWWRWRRVIGKHRATRTVMAVTVIYILLWGPYFLSRPLCIDHCQHASVVQSVTSAMGFASMGLNVVIYSIVNRDFRRAYRRILRIRPTSVRPA